MPDEMLMPFTASHWGRTGENPDADFELARAMHHAQVRAVHQAQLATVAERAAQAARQAVLSGASTEDLVLAVLAALEPVQASTPSFGGMGGFVARPGAA